MGVAASVARHVGRGLVALVIRPLLGRPLALPPALVARYPELAEARWREGGLPPRVGGWLLGRSTVAGITLWRTVFLARGASRQPPSPALLLHELGHVRQFARSRTFPAHYCWESVRRGYVHNVFELEAESFACRVLAERAGGEEGAREA